MSLPRLLLRASLLGALLGLPLLGVGGRVAMRVIADANGVAGVWTPSGTLTVLLCGVVAGVAGALVYAGLGWKLSARPWVRGAVFGLFLAFITARGLNPVARLPLMLFSPLVLVYGVLLTALWQRVVHSSQKVPGTFQKVSGTF